MDCVPRNVSGPTVYWFYTVVVADVQVREGAVNVSADLLASGGRSIGPNDRDLWRILLRLIIASCQQWIELRWKSLIMIQAIQAKTEQFHKISTPGSDGRHEDSGSMMMVFAE